MLEKLYTCTSSEQNYFLDNIVYIYIYYYDSIYEEGYIGMSKMMKILKSDDHESRQRRLTRLRNEIAYLSEEAELIEMTLDTPKTQ